MHKDKNSKFKETVNIQSHKKTAVALERALQALEEMKANNIAINFIVWQIMQKFLKHGYIVIKTFVKKYQICEIVI